MVEMRAQRVVVTHVKNEEYLLQWWIPHHAKKFDFGVVIDYNSTDRSMQMFRDMVPHWQIIPSRNKDFNALNCDIEVFNIEGAIFNHFRNELRHPFLPWVVALNSTEFLIGDTNKLRPLTFRSQKFLACDIMVDALEEEWVEPDPNRSLIEQRTHGIPLEYYDCRNNPYESKIDQIAYHRAAVDPEFHKNVHYSNRVMRSMHNFNLNYMDTSMYGTGRHYWATPCEDFRILWYTYSPYTKRMLDRKLAIQHQIPIEDRMAGRGPSHFVDEVKAERRLRFHQEFMVDLKSEIERLEAGV